MMDTPRPVPREPLVSWELRRNCSLTPGQFFRALSIPLVAGAAVAMVAWVVGYPVIAWFALVEWGGVVAAALVHARHTGDCDIVTLSDGYLTVEQRCAGCCKRSTINARALRVSSPEAPHGLVKCAGAGRSLELGRHVAPSRRLRFAAELKHALAHQAARPESPMPWHALLNADSTSQRQAQS